MNKTTLQDFIDGRIVEAIYFDPAKIFGGEWRQRGARKVCTAHILTDGHRSHDGNGTYISSSRPHLLCDGGDPRTNTEVVKYIEQARGCNRMEATHHIADAYGITFPDLQEETPEDRQRRQRRAKQRRTAEAMKFADTATPTDGQREALDYLHRRGLSDHQIADAGIVYISSDPTETEAHAKLSEIWQTVTDRIREESRPGGVWPTSTKKAVYRLAWPVWSSGQLSGYVFAALPSDRAEAVAQGRPKYKLAKFDDTTVVFDLKPAQTKRKPWQLSTLIAVEGYFDAWTAARALEGTQYPDVVAYINGAITTDQAEAIHRAGYDRVVFVPDWEGQTETRTIAQGAKLQADHIESSRAALRRAGVGMYVADLRDDAEPQTKQDANSYVETYGEEAFREAIAQASTVAQYSVATAPYQFGEEVGAMRADEVKAYIRRVIAEETDPAIYAQLLSDQTVAVLYGNDMAAAKVDIQAERERVKAETRNKARVATLQRAAVCLSKGDDIGAEKALKRLGTLNNNGDEQDYYKRPTCNEEIYQEFAQIEANKGISTGWDFGGLDLNLPAAGISVFGLPTNHGKTTILENVCLKALHQTAKPVWYIHYEEPQATLTQNLIKIEANYPRKLTAETLRNEPQTSRLAKARDFIFEARKSGRLFLLADTPTVEQLCSMIMKAAETDGIGCLIIDYIQLIRCEARANGQKETMAEVCRQFIALARKTNIPIVTASQLNRNPLGPLDLSLYDIADASDIAHAADRIIIGWNTSKKPEKGARGFGEDGQPTRAAMALEDNGASFDYDATSTTLYLELAKARGRKAGSSAIVPFDMVTGKIGY